MKKTSGKLNNGKGSTLFVVVSMSFLATLDASIVNIALPVMSKSLDVPLLSIEWVVASYVMIICSTLLFFGRLGDIVGKSKVFSYGTLLFVIGTLLCGLCSSFVPLIICRFIEGLGASAYMANNQGIITELYPQEGRGKALGILAAAVALGTMTGAPVGGFIVSALSWNYIFYVNVPIGAVIFGLGLKYLPKDRKNRSQHIDIAGAVLQFLGTMLLFVALVRAQGSGLSNPYILSVILLAVIMIILFICREKRSRQPLLDLSLFKNHLFPLSLGCAVISFMCIAASTFLLPFYFEDTLKLSPSISGLLMMITPIVIASLSALCGTLADRIGAEILTVIGLSVMAVDFFLMSFLGLHTTLGICGILLVTMAIGQSFFQPANNSLIMSACPKSKLGIGGSVNSLVRNLGQYSGIILSTTFLYAFMSRKIGYTVTDYIEGRDDVFVYGMKNDYRILMLLCAFGAMLTGLRLARSKAMKEQK
ncbi:MAG: MFS transporter [Spirochaetia bacterium]|jgi:EmrB/QacA subfamily drug resistance transporter|nr:MFS transporter [Spirochaetia bacterium]